MNENEQTMTLEEYKKKVETYLLKMFKGSKERVSELMRTYEPDFLQFFNENWEISVAATAMVMGY